ncbi:MAG: amino acid--tRNA ligase-related protein [Chlamydiota bacterium]
MCRVSDSALSLLQARAELLKSVRAFFARRSVLEVDLPYLIPKAQIDAYIDPIETPFGFLHTSPEFTMKKVLSKAPIDLYQIAHVFRAHEEGRYHKTEFSMVEWYRMGFSYEEIIEETLKLLEELLGPKETVYATHQELWKHVPKEDSRDKEILFDTFIVPKLKEYPITVVTHYPPESASLANIKNGLAERFEIYVRGLELANGFVECTCKESLRRRFEEQNALRERSGKKAFAIDEAFLDASENLPPCAGVSLGLDRAFLLQRKKTHIEEVSPLHFPT